MKKCFLLILSISSTLISTAQVYDKVVAKDGSGDYTTINAALNAAPTGTTRTTIFIKKGVYNEKVFLGSATASVSKVISLIGENRDSVVITNADYNGMVKPYYTGTSNVTYGTPQSATLTVNATDFYMENITVQNSSTTAQAVALYNVGDRQILKNCRLAGFQDTYYPKKGRRGFYYKTVIEGRTDFICGGGPNYFLQCPIKSVNGGSYITAPEDITYSATISTGKTLYYGFIFKDCDLVSDGLVSSGSVFLGRPWQNTSGSVYLNCRLGNHINPLGWYAWNATVSTTFLAEFRSMNATGTALANVSNRVSWSYQLDTADVNNFLKLSKVYASLGSAVVFDPIPFVVGPTPVSAVAKNGQSLQWTEVAGAKGYVVYADGSVVGFTKTGSFIDTATRSTTPVYSVCTVGAHGNLSLTDGSVDAVTATTLNDKVNGTISSTAVKSTKVATSKALVQGGTLRFDLPTDFALYSMTGQKLLQNKQVVVSNLNGMPKGIFLLKACDALNGDYQTKIKL